MDFTGWYLPMEWEEQWSREKEMRRRRVMEEGGEGSVEEDNRQLRRIVAYNDARMGARVQNRKNVKRSDGVTGQEGGEEEVSREKDGEPDDEVHVCRNQVYPTEVFHILKDFRDSSLLTDLTLSTEDGKSFQVHSPVLAAVSSLVRHGLQEEDGRVEGSRERRGIYVETEDQGTEDQRREDQGTEDRGWSMLLGTEVDGMGLMGVLEFAYTGAIATLDRDTLTQIQAAAQTMGVPRVLDLCTEGKESMIRGGGQRKEERKISAVEQVKISLQSIRELRMERIGCDVTLEVEGKSLHVHRVLLAASSDYFRGMFTSGMKESQQPCVTLPFLLASELEALIGCSYSGALPLSWGCVFEITCTALQLQFRHALSLCLDFMRQEMEASSCLDVASFAEAYGMPDLLEEANDFVLRNFQEVSASGKFLDLPAGKLLDFLRRDGLCVPTELAVFRAVVSWVEADPEGRRSLAGKLMAAVRFSLMTFRELREVRAVDLRMECGGSEDVKLYASALREFGRGLSDSRDRVRRPKDALVLVGGIRLNPDVGPCLPSRELWFANSLRSGTGLVKGVEWRRLGEMPDRPRFRHALAVMEGRLYMAGGCDAKDDTMKCAYSYDPMQDSWRRLSDMQESRSNFPVVVRGGRLYAVGGDREAKANTESVEAYDPLSDSWSYVRPLDRALSGQAAAVLDGEIFISGGFNSAYVCLVSVFLYHPERGTSYLADMSHDRAQHCMGALHGRLYVAGGVCNLQRSYADQLACEVYDPMADSWSAFPPLPLPHVGAAWAVLEEKMYILGGYCQEDYNESGRVHRYDLSTRRWENMGKMPGAISDIRACLLSLPKELRQ